MTTSGFLKSILKGFTTLGFLGFLIIGCNGADGPEVLPGPNDVFMQDIKFVPADRTVPVNTTVTWTNMEVFPHTATSGTPGSPSGLFNSGTLLRLDTYSFMFDTAGVYPYYCMVHGAMMTGTITVTP